MPQGAKGIFGTLRSLLDSLESRARSLKKKLAIVWYAFGDVGTGLPARLVMGLALAYALSPVDLIPDFIPVLGYLDDLVIVPALLSLALRMIPAEVYERCAAEAEANPPSLRKNWLTGAVFIALWIALLLWIGSRLLSLFAGRT
jgi:uncharacterized membrane protein YkvA (DUF1232 family)